MNRVIFLLLTILAIPVLADDGWGEISSKEIKPEHCISTKSFNDLFSLSVNPNFTGTAQFQQKQGSGRE